MPLAALIALFIVLPLAEAAVIIWLADNVIGLFWTVALLVADSVIGAALLRSQGRAVWRRFNEALAAGRMPHKEVQDGVLVIFGGAFLITPGFLTDVVGVLLLLPPSRAILRRLIMRMLGRRMRLRAGRSGGVWDVEGTASEYEPPPRPLER